MSKQINKIFQIILFILCLAHPVLSEAAQSLDSKVIPITPNTYRKDPTAPKKAVRKETTKTTTTTADKNKSTQETKTSSSVRASSSNTIPSKTTTIKSSSSIKVQQKTDEGQKTTATNTTSSNTKATTSSLKTTSNKTQTATSKTPTKTTVPTTTTKVNTTTKKDTSTSSTKVSKPQKLKEERTAKKDRVPEPILKVKLGTESHTKVTVTLPDGGTITNSKGKRISTLKNGGTFNWTSIVDKKAKKKKKPEHLNETLSVKPNKNIFNFNGTDYRGKLSLKLTEKGAVAVNEVSIEDYLRGVVGREIGSSSPQESLKAQSVIARTYAYANKGRHGSDGADVCNTTHCQVYFGKNAETASVDKAIKDTRGYILSYNSKPISALYHATCGGMTSNNEDVWGGIAEPFLRRVKCNFCEKGTKYRWSKEISIIDLRNSLAKEGVKLEEVYGASIEAPSVMDRVTNIVFQTKNGEQKIRGTTVRRIFNLPSTTFIIDDREEKANLLALAQEKKLRYEENSKPIPYNNIQSILITSFSDTQYSPKQLLVYTSEGLKRARIPSEGWKCISYNPIEKSIALSSKSEDNYNSNKKFSNKSLVTTTIKTPPKKKVLKPVTKLNIFGRGFGHQVGLCQSGAVEMGKIGWNYRQILAHYYQGVAIKNLGY
jgi:stage II sporulation protein D